MLKKQPNPPTMKMFDDPEEEELIWKVREGGLGATAWVPGHPDAWPGWEDSAVPPEKVGNYLRDLRMERARAELVSGECQNDAGVALRWGFAHLGRFSASYKARYGESPSQSVRRHG